MTRCSHPHRAAGKRSVGCDVELAGRRYDGFVRRLEFKVGRAMLKTVHAQASFWGRHSSGSCPSSGAGEGLPVQRSGRARRGVLSAQLAKTHTLVHSVGVFNSLSSPHI